MSFSVFLGDGVTCFKRFFRKALGYLHKPFTERPQVFVHLPLNQSKMIYLGHSSKDLETDFLRHINKRMMIKRQILVKSFTAHPLPLFVVPHKNANGDVPL